MLLYQKKVGIGKQIISSVTSDSGTEGVDANLVHTVATNVQSGIPETYAFSIVDVTTSPGDYGTPTFSNGVTHNSVDGTITIPPNVTSFDVTVPINVYGSGESSEYYEITVGTETATGTIVPGIMLRTYDDGGYVGAVNLTANFTQTWVHDIDPDVDPNIPLTWRGRAKIINNEGIGHIQNQWFVDVYKQGTGWVTVHTGPANVTYDTGTTTYEDFSNTITDPASITKIRMRMVNTYSSSLSCLINVSTWQNGSYTQ